MEKYSCSLNIFLIIIVLSCNIHHNSGSVYKYIQIQGRKNLHNLPGIIIIAYFSTNVHLDLIFFIIK